MVFPGRVATCLSDDIIRFLLARPPQRLQERSPSALKFGVPDSGVLIQLTYTTYTVHNPSIWGSDRTCEQDCGHCRLSLFRADNSGEDPVLQADANDSLTLATCLGEYVSELVIVSEPAEGLVHQQERCWVFELFKEPSRRC